MPTFTSVTKERYVCSSPGSAVAFLQTSHRRGGFEVPMGTSNPRNRAGIRHFTWDSLDDFTDWRKFKHCSSLSARIAVK
jgi:hypothetical protein